MSTQATSASKTQFYNTLTQKLEAFEPSKPGEVRIYVCGPTVYDAPHAGHARSAVAFDVLVRHLRDLGNKVTFVRNITDIDDKILKRSQESGEPPLELSKRMAKIYQEDMASMSCVEPDHQPKVSDHLPEVINLVERLVQRGAAYVVDMPNGSKDVYFSVRSFAPYGKLSRRNIDDLEVGARVERSDEKRNPLDFALWKGAPGEAYGWDSPWGKGRPGWHIECSAMSERYLGFGFDIHGGGMDLIFPHHENEIAQSEAAHPGEGDFARVWMHNGFLNVDKEKMSKSLGNFVTVRDVFDRYDPEGFRYFLLTVQYRGPLTFDSTKLDNGRVVFPGIEEAERRVDYLYSTLDRLALLAAEDTPSGKQPAELVSITAIVDAAKAKISAALDDDLNTPVALAVLAELAKAANDLCDLATKKRKDLVFQKWAKPLAQRAQSAINSCTLVLGLLRTSSEAYALRTKQRRMNVRGLDAQAIENKIAERAAAREAKDFKRGDEIRAELLSLGVEIADTPQGTTWRLGV
jgi:cysteinyl-tRNA synthetase